MPRTVRIIRPRVPPVTPKELQVLMTIAHCQGAWGFSPSLSGRAVLSVERKGLLAPFDPTYRQRLGWHLSILGMDVLEAAGVDIGPYRERTKGMARGP